MDYLADTRTERSRNSTALQLEEVNGKITAADILLGTAGIEPKLFEKTTDDRAAMLVRRTTLTKRGRSVAGLEHFLTEVEDEQVDAQVVALTAIKTGITAHRATLPA